MDRLRWRWSANTARIVLVSSVLLIVLYTRLYTSGFVSKGTNRSSTPYASSPVLAGCRSLPGVEDILVVLKTGATEALSKLPVHFTTTLHCIPHYLIISDYAETINDNALVDVLQSVNEDIRRTVPEFELYNRLSESGRGALQSDEVSRWALTPNTNQGKDNPAWKLDKWKFLPMVESASNYKPDARWYVFLEADSYICWPNLLAWLALYNSDEPHYLGSQMQIGSTVFAYGGAGYAISQPAMRKVVEYRRAHLTELEEYTKNNWAGDEVLGHALLQAGVSLQWTYPNTQNELPGRIDYTSLAYGKRIWCYAPIGWHHMDPTDIESMYTFDRAWNYTVCSHSLKTSQRTPQKTLNGRELTHCGAGATASSPGCLSRAHPSTNPAS